MTKVSVVILNYNGKKYLKDCLDSVLTQKYPSFDIVLIDNASSDGSVEYVKSIYEKQIAKKRLKLIENCHNEGFAEGNNIGVRNAEGEYIVLLNNDTKVLSGWLQGLVSALESRENIGTVGSVAWSESRAKMIEQFYYEQKMAGTMNLCGEDVSRPQKKEEYGNSTFQAFYVGGYSMIFRKNDFPKPFDKNYFAYAEDVYLGWISMLRGYINIGTLKSKVIHYGGSTKKIGSGINKISIFNGTKNQIMNHFIFYEWKNVFKILPLFLITQFTHVVQNPRKFIIKLKAYYWIATHWRMIMEKRRKIQYQRKVPDAHIIKIMSCKFFDDNSSLIKTKIAKRAVRICNMIFYQYCYFMRIRTLEFQKKSDS